MKAYHISYPSQARIPIVVSVPHCGTAFPDDILDEYDPGLIAVADDTDWFVDRLYHFAPSLGITMIAAVFSRWVIDLNRDPESKPLYTDGRIITELCPSTTFLGQPLYRDRRAKVAGQEVARRMALYFHPYHAALEELLTELKEEFGMVLLWDCHSIRQVVPTISKNKFPDLILGSAGGASAAKELIEKALQGLSKADYTLQHNDPFKGGYITRKYGQPVKHQHALQLEMSKINYMDERERSYDPNKAKKMAELLYNTISGLTQTLITLKDH